MMMKKRRALHGLGLLSILAISLVSFDALGTKKWLIFGAGMENDTPEWNSYFKGKDVEWISFNVQDWCQKCIVGDFNSVEDLDNKLKDNAYDVIVFDQATVKFSLWSAEHLSVLYRKLKELGALYIPVSYTSSWLPHPTYEEFKQGLKKTVTENTFWNAGNRRSYTFFPFRKRDTFNSRLEQEDIHPHNIALLERIFGKGNAQFRYGGQYPNRNIKDFGDDYYIAVKKPTQPFQEAIWKKPYSPRIGEYTIKGRLVYPEGPGGELSYVSLTDKDKNVYVLQYPTTGMTTGEVLSFINAQLGTNYIQIYSKYGGWDPKYGVEDHEEAFGLDTTEVLLWYSIIHRLEDIPLIGKAAEAPKQEEVKTLKLSGPKTVSFPKTVKWSEPKPASSSKKVKWGESG